MTVLRPVVLRSVSRSISGLRGEKRPVLAGHKLLYRCNLECQMCPFWRREDEPLLNLAQEVRMMNSLERAGVSFLGFEGGEPLLRPELPAILEEAHARFHTSVVTNGWLLSQRFREIRKHLEYLFVSLDGIGETHDRLRGIPRSFERAVAGIRTVGGDVPVAISHTVTKDNLGHAERLVALAEELGVRITVQVAYDYSTADAMSPDRARLRETLVRLRELKRAGAPILESPEYFDALLGSWYGDRPWTCRPWMTINIDPSGRIVMPCYVLQEYNGKTPVWDVDVRALWNSFEWERYGSCNKCALACYLEPSLFSWANPAMVRERVLEAAVAYLRSRRQYRAHDRRTALESGKRLPVI
ncbi:MAG: PTO1314 family radical SAM protein [Thermoplasmata archaeon]